MFAFWLRERDMFCQAVQNVWAEGESFRVLGIPTPVWVAYTADKVPSATRLKRELIQKTVEVEHRLSSLGAFLLSLRYSSTDGLSNLRTVSG